MTDNPNHHDQLIALKRIEGQVRGLQKMIEDKRYCIDIMTQISAVTGALLKVQDNILDKHLNMCVNNALTGKSLAEKKEKIKEVISVIKKFRKCY